ncbi:MAG: MotA/TolQ/ExbB proton channel family protein [Verrucomicrobiales bacterium]
MKGTLLDLMEAITLTELFAKAGALAWPILFCSVIGLAIILERGTVFFLIHQRGKTANRVLAERGKFSPTELKMALEPIRHPVARVAVTYLKNLNRDSGLRMELVKKTGAEELARVERRLRGLATISHVTPLLGLLGTVLGMVLAFAQIEGLEGAAKPSDLAGGIWEALLTTVFGLIVAIPCMAAFHGFESAADGLAQQMEFTVTDLDDWLSTRSGQAHFESGTISDEAFVR